MKLAYTIFITILTLFSTTGQSQEVKLYELGTEEYKYPVIAQSFSNSKEETILIVSEQSAHFYGMYRSKDYLEVYDREMNLTKRVDFSDVIPDIEDLKIESMLQMKDVLILATSKKDGVKGERLISMLTINLIDLSLVQRKDIYSLSVRKDPKLAGPEEGAMLVKSRNDEYCLLIARPMSHGKENEKVKLWLFDANLDLKWEYKDFEVEKKDKYYTILNYAVGNSGEAFFLGYNSEEHNVDLYGFDENGHRNRKVEFEYLAENKGFSFFLRGLAVKMGIDNDGMLVLSGYYSDEESHGMKGVFFRKYNPTTLKLIVDKQSSFTDEFLKSGISEDRYENFKKVAAKKQKVLAGANFESHMLTFDSEGNAILIGEQNLRFFEMNSNLYNMKSLGLIVTKFNSDGELLSQTKIPRRHYVKKNEKSPFNYSVFWKNDILNFVFVDDVLNCSNDIGLPVTSGGTVPGEEREGDVLAVVSLDDENVMHKQAILKLEERDKPCVFLLLESMTDMQKMVVHLRYGIHGTMEFTILPN